jgi:CIC family chloride channel protein
MATATFLAQFKKLHGKSWPVLSTSLFGLVASLAAVAFQLAIGWLYRWLYQVPSAGAFWRFAWISLAVIVISSLIVGWLLNSYCPEAAGSGIPQVKLAYWKEFGYAPRRIAWIKFLAGIVSIGGGQSLGREGPTVQIGSNLSSSLAGLLGVPKQKRRSASAAGAAAGLAAAFNSPLAAVAFVLEEIIGDLNSRALGSVLLASVIGAFVVHAVIGAQPAFVLPAVGEPTWRAYLMMPLVAAFAALVGILFQRGSLSLRGRLRHFNAVPKWLHPLLGGLTTWVAGVAIFSATGRLGVFGLGYDDLSDALTHGMAWRLAALLLLGKLIATIASYGFGGCGGIFSPNLFLGGMCGALVAGISSHVFALQRPDELLLAIGGMSACLGAVVQAPVTAVLIIFEMTHQFAVVPGLMIAALVSQVLARTLVSHNFYDEVLLQDGHQMEHVVPPRDLRTWQSLPISAIANFSPIVIEDVSEAALQEVLASHPYRYFPVVENKRVKGIAPRAEIEAALLQQRPLRLLPARECSPGDTIGASQLALIDSASGTVIVTDGEGRMLAVVTLHDLLRAQVSMSER